MACNCTHAGTIPKCTTTLELGEIGATNTAVYVVIENIGTRRKHIQSVTTDGKGLVTIDLTDPAKGFYVADQDYEVHVSIVANANVFGDKETMTVSGTDDTCFYINFAEVLDSSGNVNEITTQTIGAA